MEHSFSPSSRIQYDCGFSRDTFEFFFSLETITIKSRSTNRKTLWAANVIDWKIITKTWIFYSRWPCAMKLEINDLKRARERTQFALHLNKVFWEKWNKQTIDSLCDGETVIAIIVGWFDCVWPRTKTLLKLEQFFAQQMIASRQAATEAFDVAVCVLSCILFTDNIPIAIEMKSH